MNFHFCFVLFQTKKPFLTIFKKIQNTQGKNIHYFVALEKSKSLKSRSFVICISFHFIFLNFIQFFLQWKHAPYSKYSSAVWIFSSLVIIERDFPGVALQAWIRSGSFFSVYGQREARRIEEQPGRVSWKLIYLCLIRDSVQKLNSWT